MSRSSLLAPAHQGGPGKRAVKQLWCGVVSGYWCERAGKRRHAVSSLVSQLLGEENTRSVSDIPWLASVL